MTSPETPGSSTSPFYELITRPTIALPVPSTNASKQLTTRPGVLCGFALASTGGAAAACRLWDGDGNTGTLIASIDCAANAGEAVGPGVDGPHFKVGLYLEVVTGSIEGGVWVKI